MNAAVRIRNFKSIRDFARVRVAVGQVAEASGALFKQWLDCLRVMGRNVFYQALQPFKKAYNNYRDDHDQFRQLTQASGVLEEGPAGVTAHLMPRVGYPPQLRRIMGAVLEGINAQAPILPDGSGRRLRLRLAQRSEMLQGAGHDVATAVSQNLASAADDDLLRQCTAEERALVSPTPVSPVRPATRRGPTRR